jgi:MFS family permease
MVGWALLADVVPLYPLYALLFADTGMSGAQISALFAIWSAVGVIAEVPSGALADRFSRRACLVAAGVLQACGYAGGSCCRTSRASRSGSCCGDSVVCSCPARGRPSCTTG